MSTSNCKAIYFSKLFLLAILDEQKHIPVLYIYNQPLLIAEPSTFLHHLVCVEETKGSPLETIGPSDNQSLS